MTHNTQLEEDLLKSFSRTFPCLPVFIFLLIAKISFPTDFFAPVVGVSDGDTITGFHNDRGDPCVQMV